MAKGNRKDTEAFCLTYIDKLAPGGENKKIYTDLFAKMSDLQFDSFMAAIRGGKRLAVIAPNFGKKNVLSVENNFKLAKELKHEFFERIWIEGDEDTPTYLTPIKYLVIDLPVRRQAQLLIKKLSVPEDNLSVDDFTGQATGKSQAASISYPEVQVMAGMGLDNCQIEMIKYRGGDRGGFLAMNGAISKQGSVSLNAIKHLSTGVLSTRLLSNYLTGMHLGNTLLAKAAA